MADDSGKYKLTKKLYSRRYRQTHKAAIRTYERKPKQLKDREARNAAEGIMSNLKLI